MVVREIYILVFIYFSFKTGQSFTENSTIIKYVASEEILLNFSRDSENLRQIFIFFLSFQRPKKKPLQEYYNDDDAELEGSSSELIFPLSLI